MAWASASSRTTQLDIRKRTPKVLWSVGDTGRDRRYASTWLLAEPSAVAGVRQLINLTCQAGAPWLIHVKFTVLETHLKPRFYHGLRCRLGEVLHFGRGCGAISFAKWARAASDLTSEHQTRLIFNDGQLRIC